MRNFSAFLITAFAFSCANNRGSDHCKRYDAIDLEMLNTYQEIETKYEGEERFLKRFKDAQVYWIQYRDRQVKALFPLDKKIYKAKDWDSYTNCKCKELNRLTVSRTRELQVWLEGTRAECPTSVQD